MADDQAILIPIRETENSQAAVVFLHGFGGHPAETWGEFGEFLAQHPGLQGWSLYSLGYHTKLSPDIRGVWSGNPDLGKLATYLRTRANAQPLRDFKALAIVAHSMGGLVTQRALVDDADFVRRVGQVFLFGTPSGGLRKAGWLRWLNVQTGDMAHDSEFIQDLRARWDQQFANDPPFRFWSVAGDHDEFVPANSSLDPFADDFHAVVPGDHLEIVKPEQANSLSVKLVAEGIIGDAAPGGPWNAARVAVERKEFERAVELFEGHANELDTYHAIQLALALEGVGRADRAREMLKDYLSEREPEARLTDALGVLAGRYKRRWLSEGREADASRAEELYRQGYELSAEVSRHHQAYYHGINLAFLEFARHQNSEAARKRAQLVLEHCRQSKPSHWRAATEGEAHLYLGETEPALDAYRQAVEFKPKPRELHSMYSQAVKVASLLRNEAALSGLESIFRRETNMTTA